MRAFLILVIYLATHVLFVFQSQARTDSSSCLNLVTPLEKKREDVESEGGVWGIFSKTPSLSRHSSKAIKLDSKISKLVWTLTYLCETRSGVPLNELASYVSRKVAELGEKRFKSLHIKLGKPEQEIEDWLAYTKIALAKRERVLESKKVRKSIQGAGGFITKYWNLFTECKNQNKVNPLLSRTTSLNQEIDEFLIGDPYVALAILEESQIPFWDIDENYGGS